MAETDPVEATISPKPATTPSRTDAGEDPERAANHTTEAADPPGEPKPSDEEREDPDHTGTSTLVHALAVSLHQLGKGLESVGRTLRQATEAGKESADQVVERAVEKVRHALDDLREKAERARERGVDFLDRHRDEIIALLVTAGKIALVIGIRRLTASKPGGERRPASRRLEEAGKVLTALLDEVGKLLSSSPSTLPLLRERFREGDAGEQAIISMLLGPSLVGSPDHAVEVIGEFLASAKDTEAADAIGRRSLAPVLSENPSALRDVRPLLKAAGPLVRRGALVALTRHMQDKRSRLGDVLAAAVIVLEDHDHEAHQALTWLLETASQIDAPSTARSLAQGIRTLSRGDPKAADELVETLPLELRDPVAAALDEEE